MYGLTKDKYNIFIDICREYDLNMISNVRDRLKKTYDRMNISNDFINSASNSYLNEMDSMFKNTNLNNKQILDVGTGNGLMSIYLSLKYPSCNITSIDENTGNGADSNILNFLTNIILKYDIKNINVKILDYWDNTKKYDVIVCRHSIHHIPNLRFFNKLHHKRKLYRKHNHKQYKLLFEKLYVDLKDNGVLIISDVNRDTLFYTLPYPISKKIRNVRWETKPSLLQWKEYIAIFDKTELEYLVPKPLIRLGRFYYYGLQFIFPNVLIRCYK